MKAYMEDYDFDSEKEELLEHFDAMSDEDREVLLRVAEYLATNPPDGPKSMEDMEELFERFKHRH